MSEDGAIELVPEARRGLGFQSYGARPEINGVVYRPLIKHRALEGAFMEVLRLDEGRLYLDGLVEPFEVQQISTSWAAPGRTNAFHIHPKRLQDELWCVLEGELLVWLVDLRKHAGTSGQKRSYLLSGEAPALLHIPSGVAHGYRASARGALLLYAMNAQFDPLDPNEGRLSWDFFGAALWEEDRG